MSSEFDKVKRELTTIERDIDTAISELSRIVVEYDRSAGSDIELGNPASHQIGALQQTILQKITKFEDTMPRLHAACNTTPSAVQTGIKKRFSDTVARQRHEFQVIWENYQQKVAEKSLFGSKKGGSSDGSGLDSLLRERGSLVHSHRTADEVLANAMETQDALARQRRSLQQSSSVALSRILSQLPSASALMSSIGARRSRNDRIVAAVVGLLIFVVIFLKMQ